MPLSHLSAFLSPSPVSSPLPLLPTLIQTQITPCTMSRTRNDANPEESLRTKVQRNTATLDHVEDKVCTLFTTIEPRFL